MTDRQNARRAGMPPARRGTSSHSPFAGAGFGIGVALAAMVASLAWRIADGALPGGRWPAVHLFTLGALTPLIATFMPRFAAALLHTRSTRRRSERIRMVLLVLSAAMTITGRLTANTVLLACGATGLSLAVGWLQVELRRDRRRALPARFTFIPRAYEHACGAFIWGALLGVLLGAGVFTGRWYAAARAAHLQLMLLGWGGITLLATMVMFGPAVMRARIRPGADARAARMLPHAVMALSIAGFALLATGAGGVLGTGARLIAAAALVVYAGSVVAVCVPVIRASVHAPPTAARSFIVAAAVWFIVAVSLDIASVAGASPMLTDAAAVALLFGVLLHAILASITHVLPLVIGRDAADRSRIGLQMGALHRSRAALLSAGTLLVIGELTIAPGSVRAQTGWVLIAVSVIVTAGLASTGVVGARRPSY